MTVSDLRAERFDALLGTRRGSGRADAEQPAGATPVTVSPSSPGTASIVAALGAAVDGGLAPGRYAVIALVHMRVPRLRATRATLQGARTDAARVKRADVVLIAYRPDAQTLELLDADGLLVHRQPLR